MILLTGAAGFIGYHVARKLLARGERVLGIDNLNAYYDPALKQGRLAALRTFPNFVFQSVDIADAGEFTRVLNTERSIEQVIHLAAQAGVRYSMTHPHAYVDSNLVGFLNLLEWSRTHTVQQIIYASSSSVYGATDRLPFALDDRADEPISLYAATKRANELMAYVYARQFGVPLTGLRFFTVYGPWGRPDMAPMKFTRALLAGEPIDVYNHGDMRRDFTYIDDVVNAVISINDRPPAPLKGVPSRLYNVGNHKPEPLMRFISVLADALGCEPKMRMQPMQPGDVPETFADITEINTDYGWSPSISIDRGIPEFVNWYRSYFKS